MEVNYIVEGLKFMLLGMGTVFSFLLLLIYILKFQEKIFKRFFPEKEIKTTPKVSAMTEKSDDDSQVIAAITAAITDFKKTR